MSNINKLEQSVEKIIQKIEGLNYKFSNSELKEDADETKKEIVSNLELFLEIAVEDSETEENLED